MFPSPIGELHFSINMDRSNNKRKVSFRPLSGSYISQLYIFSLSLFSLKVSVPYRGATFLNGTDDSMYKNFTLGFRPLSGSYISQ